MEAKLVQPGVDAGERHKVDLPLDKSQRLLADYCGAVVHDFWTKERRHFPDDRRYDTLEFLNRKPLGLVDGVYVVYLVCQAGEGHLEQAVVNVIHLVRATCVEENDARVYRKNDHFRTLLPGAWLRRAERLAEDLVNACQHVLKVPFSFCIERQFRAKRVHVVERIEIEKRLSHRLSLPAEDRGESDRSLWGHSSLELASWVVGG